MPAFISAHVYFDNKIQFNSRQRDGLVANIMRRTRAAHHLAVRSVKQNNSDIVRQRLAIALLLTI